MEVTWWREGDREVDYVLAGRSGVLAIEVASGRRKAGVPGLAAFDQRFGPARKLLIGGQGLALDTALSTPAAELYGA